MQSVVCNPAADPVRVSFRILENQEIKESPASVDDWSWAQSQHSEMHPDHEFAWHKPSVFYFRRELRRSPARSRAVSVALIIIEEFEHLAAWATEHNASPFLQGDAVLGFYRLALRECASHSQAVELGLSLCHQLEQLQAYVSAAGLIPPKWTMTHEEAEENGYQPAEAAQ